MEADGGGNLEPGLAGCHAGGHIRGADAGGESAQGTVGAGVAVRADDAVTGGDHTLLGKQSVLDAHFAYVVEMADAVGTGKLAALLALLGGLDVLVGDEVVEDDGDFILVENGVKAVLGELVDGHGGGDVVAQDDVQLGLNQLTGGYNGKSCVGSENFLC